MKRYPVISVVYNRLKYKSKSGFAPVHYRIYFRGLTDYLIMDDIPPIHKRDWIGDSGQSYYVADIMINDQIKQSIDHARDWSQKKVLQGNPISVQEIKAYLKGSNSKETFNEFVRRYIKNINQNKAKDEKLAFRTIQTYKSFEGRLSEFRQEILFDDITPAFVSKFERFLAVDCGQRGVTRAKHFDKLKICYRAARKEGLVKYDEKVLFDDVKIKEEKSRRVSLTQAELKLIRDKKLPDSKDDFFKSIFLFGCLTGLYYSDIRILTSANIEEVVLEENGESKNARYLTGLRSKNEEEFVVPIFPDTERILLEHSTISKPDSASLFEGLISDQKFNAKLKTIAKDLGIHKSLSAKVARHTFAEIMVSIGNPIKKVGRALGHTQVSTTEIYGRQSKANAMRGWKEFSL